MDKSIALSILTHVLLTRYPEEYLLLEGNKDLLAYKLSNDACWLLNHLEDEWELNYKKRPKRKRNEHNKER